MVWKLAISCSKAQDLSYISQCVSHIHIDAACWALHRLCNVLYSWSDGQRWVAWLLWRKKGVCSPQLIVVVCQNSVHRLLDLSRQGSAVSLPARLFCGPLSLQPPFCVHGGGASLLLSRHLHQVGHQHLVLYPSFLSRLPLIECSFLNSFLLFHRFGIQAAASSLLPVGSSVPRQLQRWLVRGHQKW